MKRGWQLIPLLLSFAFTGCGSFVAHRMVEAPNRYPTWLHPEPRVTLLFGANLLTNFPVHFVTVGPPEAKLCYRVMDPEDYRLRGGSARRVEHGRTNFVLSFGADVPGKTNQWTLNPRGTVVLLHGYGLAQFAMTPWAFRLAQDGWRCVLVDLRGHGKSTGKKIFYGTREANDMKQLLDALENASELRKPVTAFGESYGASLALRWKAEDSRVQNVVAIAPYGSLSNATINICRDYARWIPDSMLRGGLRKLPKLLNVPARELDTTTILKRHPVPALFIAGAEDNVAPPETVRELSALAPGSEFILVPNATHEVVPYFFDDIALKAEEWIER